MLCYGLLDLTRTISHVPCAMHMNIEHQASCIVTLCYASMNITWLHACLPVVCLVGENVFPFL